MIKCRECNGVNGEVCGFPIQQIPATCEMMKDIDAWIDMDNPNDSISTIYSREITK